MIPYDYIEKGNKIYVIEKEKLKKVDSVEIVGADKIYISYKGFLLDLPEEKITKFDNGKLILAYESRDDYNSFKKNYLAKIKGNELIPEFQKYFPQGSNYEVYDYDKGSKISNCEVPEEGILNLIMNFTGNINTMTSVVKAKINPNYAIVYYRSKKYFGFAPLNETQKGLILPLVIQSKSDWTSLILSSLLISSEIFQKSVKICKILFPKIYKIYDNRSDSPPPAVISIIKKVNKKLRKYIPDIELFDDFDVIFNRTKQLNLGLMDGLEKSLKNIKAGPSGGQKVAAHLIGVPAYKLKTEPLYIFPFGENSLIVTLIPLSGFTKKPFEHYQSVYLGFKHLYQYLK